MKDYSCHRCNWLLYSAKGDIDVEVICPKCRSINYPGRVGELGLGLRGKDFQDVSIDHRCDKCCRMLFRSVGEGIVQTACFGCGNINLDSTADMRSGKQKHSKSFKAEKDKKGLAF